MVKRAFLFLLSLLLISCLVSPCFAVDNTIGYVQQDLVLVGVSIDNDGLCPQYYADSSGKIDKSLSSSADISLANKWVYYYFVWPDGITNINVKANVGIASYSSASNLKWYGWTMTGWNQGILTQVNTSGDGSLFSGAYSNGIYSYSTHAAIFSGTTYKYLVLAIYSPSGTLDTSLSFSEHTLVPSFDVDGYISSSSSVTIKPKSFSTSVNLYRLYDDGSGGFYVRRASNVQSYYQYDFSLPQTNIYLDSDSYSTTGNVFSDSPSSVLAYGLATISYQDDGDLVDTVKNIDGTLTDMAGNLQTITDDFTAKQETAQDIGGVVSDTDISNNDATLSTGMDSLDQGIDSLNISDVSAPALSFSSFMTANAVALLNFGNGVLYWALFALVILSVLLFIFRRLF